ncbi:MAG: hypothetical protein LBE59_01960 [Nevskiaceae bacterium]|nr:hypothetical protein [Nevskiaceae bacterium]
MRLLALLGAVAVMPVSAQESNLIAVGDLLANTIAGGGPSNIRGDLLLANDGNIYLASYGGGLTGGGTVASIAPGGSMTVLGALTGIGDIGAQPYGRLTQGIGEYLFGTTYVGGVNGSGTVFRVAPDGTVAMVYTFGSRREDPKLPYAGVAQTADGSLYGTTFRGGDNDAGAVYQITPAGELNVLHSFTGGDGGEYPLGTLIAGSDGALYGTTLGNNTNRGTVYRITTSGEFTTLYNFPVLGQFNANGVALNETGANPRSALLLASDGNFYGTTYQGGANGFGTVFRMTPQGDVSVIHHFSGFPSGGANPQAGLSEGEPGVLYGTTERGGQTNIGSAFRVTTDGTFTLLHSFTSSSVDGQNPYATLLPVNGELYGVSYSDASSGIGGLFKIVLPDANGALPVQFSISERQFDLGGSATLTWSSPTATSCTAAGAWSSEIGTSGAETVTPESPGFYTYVLSCVGEDGVVRNAYAWLIVTATATQAIAAVDGGASGGGAMSPWLLLLAAALLSFRLNFFRQKNTGENR